MRATCARKTSVKTHVLCHSKDKSRVFRWVCPAVRDGLFYNGAAIDLELIIDQKGVLFSFRDTALDENSFEILRRKTDKNWRPMGDYEAVVLIDSALELWRRHFPPSLLSTTPPCEIQVISLNTQFEQNSKTQASTLSFRILCVSKRLGLKRRRCR